MFIDVFVQFTCFIHFLFLKYSFLFTVLYWIYLFLCLIYRLAYLSVEWGEEVTVTVLHLHEVIVEEGEAQALEVVMVDAVGTCQQVFLFEIFVMGASKLCMI